jgi:hypothetical protein
MPGKWHVSPAGLAWLPLLGGGLQRPFDGHVVKLHPHALRHQAEDVPATGAFILPHLVPVLDRLPGDQGSFEVAADADRFGCHVRRLFPYWLLDGKTYRGRLVSPVNFQSRTNTGRINTECGWPLTGMWEAEKAGISCD